MHEMRGNIMKYLDGAWQVWFGEAQVDHASDGHPNRQPLHEAHVVDEGENILRNQHQYRQSSLKKKENN